MPRNFPMHPTDDSGKAGNPLASQSITKEEFARRLYALMNKKGMRQADLRKKADITRDSMSVYARGKSLPGPLNLSKLARALDVAPEELLPNYIKTTIESAAAPDVQLRTEPGSPGMAWLRFDKHIKLSTAVKIMALLEADKSGGQADAADGS